MIRTIKREQIEYGENPAIYCEMAGLSGDTKPTDTIATGSLFIEVNTGDVYAYDEAGEKWWKVCALGGGS